MRTISDKTEFSLHFITFKDPFELSNLPENLNAFCTDSETDEPITISFRCDDEEIVKKILVLSYKDNGTLNPIEKYSPAGIYGKSGGSELISEYLLSNFITDIQDKEYTNENWVDINGNEAILNTDGTLIIDGTSTDYRPPYLWSDINEFTVNNIKFQRKKINNLSLAPDFRNLIYQREYPEYGFLEEQTFGNRRFQYNINQENFKDWFTQHSIPDFIFDILSAEQKLHLAKRLSKYIRNHSIFILKNTLNQKFEFENNSNDGNHIKDSWGSEMYHSLGGDGDEDIYLSDGVSIRPDGSLTDD